MKTPLDLSPLPPEWRTAVATPLAGDASSRRWYRLAALSPHNDGGRTAVLMVLPKDTEKEASDSIQTNRLLSSIGWPVPRIYWSRGGRILFEDAGDRSLLETVLSAPENMDDLYRQAVSLLVILHEKGTDRVHARSRWARRAFTIDFFLSELEITEEYFFRGKLTKADPKWRQKMAEFFLPLFSEPLVLCHRDFHSRNIMVNPRRRLSVVDYQDARLGPRWYDLVSLLRDSYLDLRPEFESRCLGFYRSAMDVGKTKVESDHFLDGYYRTAVQRHLKVLGTFSRLGRQGKPSFLEFIPRTVFLARGALSRFPALSWIEDLLQGAGG